MSVRVQPFLSSSLRSSLTPRSAKAIYASFSVSSQLLTGDMRIAEFWRLWEKSKECQPNNEPITFDIATMLGAEFHKKGLCHEAKGFYLNALEGRLRVRGEVRALLYLHCELHGDSLRLSLPTRLTISLVAGAQRHPRHFEQHRQSSGRYAGQRRLP